MPAANNNRTAPAVKPIPEGMHSVTPHIVCNGAAEAIDFYVKAFGAKEESRLLTPHGAIMHACIRIGDSAVMLMEENRDWCSFGPKALKGSPVTLHLYVEDADAFFKHAVEAGATVRMPLEDMFWGDRYGVLEDPFGHVWSVATHIRDLTPEEVREAAARAFS